MTINGDHTVVAVVQRIQIIDVGVTYEVSWFDASGAFKEHWLYEWQLQLELHNGR